MAEGTKTAIFSRKAAGGVLAIEDQSVSTGSRWWVDSGAAGAGDTVGHGRSPDEPFATLAYAFSGDQPAINSGDIIYVSENHAETISAAAGIAMDLAGVRVVGLGRGDDRPTLTFSATGSTMTITAANISVENIVFLATAAVVNTIVISNEYCTIKNCLFMGNAAAQTHKIAIITTNAANDLTVDNCDFQFLVAEDGTTAITTTSSEAIRLVGADRAKITNNYMSGDFTTSAINGITTASKDIRIISNRVNNIATENIAGGIDLVTACTGVVDDNYVYVAYSTSAAALIDPASCVLGQNWVSNATTEYPARHGTSETIGVEAAVDSVGTAVSSVDDELSTVDAEVGALTTAVSSVDDELSTVDSLVGSVGTAISSVDDELSTVDAEVGALTTAVSSIDDEISSADDSIDSVGTAVSSVDDELSTVDSLVGSVGTAVSSVDDELSTVDSLVGSVGTAVSSVDDELSTVDSLVGSVGTAVSSVDDELSTVDAEIGTLTTAVSSIDDEISAVDDDVDSVGNQVVQENKKALANTDFTGTVTRFTIANGPIIVHHLGLRITTALPAGANTLKFSFTPTGAGATDLCGTTDTASAGGEQLFIVDGVKGTALSKTTDVGIGIASVNEVGMPLTLSSGVVQTIFSAGAPGSGAGTLYMQWTPCTDNATVTTA